MSPAAELTRRRALASAAALLSGCAGRGSSSGAGDAAVRGERPEATLGFVGDVMFGRNVNEAHADRPPESVWGDVLPHLDALDGLFLNLECCLSTRGERAPGRGYYFRADPDWAVPALRRAGASWVGLANNHVLDYGATALADTLDALAGGGIAHAGAGPNRWAAFEPASVEVAGLDVAVLSVTDRAPTYAAGAITPGTAYLPMLDDPLTFARLSAAMGRARATDPDLLVVSVHWGPNWATEPAGRYRRLARWLVDAGADVVHGHSAHVFQGIELYHDGLIIHDAGDFVDDYALVGDLHNDRSFLFSVEVTDGVPTSLRLRPVAIEDEAVYEATPAEARWLREHVERRSAPFGTELHRDGDGLACALSPTP